MKTYLLVLGSFPELSRAELRGRCEEVYYDPAANLLLADGLQFTNPREIPRSPEQLFIDQLGGTVRMAEVCGEFFDRTALEKAIWERIETAQKFKVGFTVYGAGKQLLGDLIHHTKDHFKKIRVENFNGKNLTSGQIFQRRILQKGHEFIVWKKGSSYLLAETVANQNLRNYELRDRQKDFRDAKMGMLPPKLAQILLNLSTANQPTDVVVLDPFCGSGTINIEAAISGFRTRGSDLNAHFAQKSQENFTQMAEKFRYAPDSGNFSEADAVACPVDPHTVVATEGWLGENFEQKPNRDQIMHNATLVTTLWGRVLSHLAEQQVSQLALCLPAWNLGVTKHSISEAFLKMAKDLGYQPVAFASGKSTSIYERDQAFVAREIVVLSRG